MVRIGIIGGSGLDDPRILQDARELHITTPFGEPSSPLTIGSIEGREVIILARHGRQHTIPPTQVNYRANVDALKSQNCTHILATTTCGSLAPEVILANEAAIPFAAVAMSTDYDSWKTDEAPVEWSDVLRIFEKNVENAKRLLLKTI